jgi:hypothetical protein
MSIVYIYIDTKVASSANQNTEITHAVIQVHKATNDLNFERRNKDVTKKIGK